MAHSAQAVMAAPLSISAKYPAAIEILTYLAVVAIGALSFVLGWLSVDGAVVLTAVLLVALIVLAWNRFDSGRHPCVLFLCTLIFFQGGKLLAFCLGADSVPLRVQIMTPDPFDLSREECGIVLLLLVLTAICVYAPCRWNYRRIVPPSDVMAERYLPYLYLVFFATLPLQLFKNYRYYQYAQEHGGYMFLFVNHAALASSVPFFVRAAQLVTLPVFMAIFVFERRKKFLALTTLLYFATAAIILLLGSRMSAFTMVLVLWYVAKIKSGRKSQLLRLAVFIIVLLAAGYAVQQVRDEATDQITTFSPIKVLDIQGASLSVTEVGVKYRSLFRPFIGSYLAQELRNAFVANDAANYYRGRDFGFDVSVLLNPVLFSAGEGAARSYVGEAYVVGGVVGVVVISLLIGVGLHFLHRYSAALPTLVVVALLLPYILIMPRNGLLDWLSALIQIGIALAVLWAGWLVYSFMWPITPVAAPRSALPVAG